MRTYSIIFLGLILIASNSCKKQGCTTEWADNYNDEAVDDDGSCIFSGAPFVGKYDMHFIFDDQDYTVDEFGNLEWYTDHNDFYDHSFEISINATGDTFNIRSPATLYGLSLPATLDEDTLRISYYTGTLVVYSYVGKAYFENDTLRYNLTYHLSNWPPALHDHVEYAGAGLRNN